MTPTPDHLDEFYATSEAALSASQEYEAAVLDLSDAIPEQIRARFAIARAIVENDPDLREFVLRYYDAQRKYDDATERVTQARRAYTDACNALIDWTSKAASLGGA